MSQEPTPQQLLTRIAGRRRALDDYLRSTRPRATRLTYASVIGSAVAAALTAGPGLGGETFVDAAADAVGGVASDIWRPLCLLATVASVVAAVAANLIRSQDTQGRIVSAEACRAELEGLETLVEFEQVSTAHAVALYQQYVAKVPFVDDVADASARDG